MQRDQAGPIGPRVEQRLIPELGLRARVGEDERGALASISADHCRQHASRRDGRPTGSARRCRAASVSTSALVGTGPARARLRSPATAEQRVMRIGQVAERRRHAPDLHARTPARAAAPARAAPARRACCRAARATRPPRPAARSPSIFLRVGAREQQREALGRGDQRGRTGGGSARALALTVCRRCAAPTVHAASSGRRSGRLQGARGVGGERAHRRQPEHRERRGVVLVADRPNAAVAESLPAHRAQQAA